MVAEYISTVKINKCVHGCTAEKVIYLINKDLKIALDL